MTKPRSRHPLQRHVRRWQERIYRLATEDPSSLINLAKAARCLDVSEKTLRRLIAAERIPAVKMLWKGKRRWVIPRDFLVLYARWRTNSTSTFPLPHQPPELRAHFAFVSSPRPLRGIPRGEIPSTLEEIWRWGFRAKHSVAAYEAAKREIQQRLPGVPDAFVASFVPDEDEALQFLWHIVRSVPVPEGLLRLTATPAREARKQLRYDALAYLVSDVLPTLDRVKKNLTAYLKQAVHYYYLSQYRTETRRR